MKVCFHVIFALPGLDLKAFGYGQRLWQRTWCTHEQPKLATAVVKLKPSVRWDQAK